MLAEELQHSDVGLAVRIKHFADCSVVLVSSAGAARRPEPDGQERRCSLADLLIRQYVIYVYLAFGLADGLIPWVYAHRIATVPLTPSTMRTTSQRSSEAGIKSMTRTRPRAV